MRVAVVSGCLLAMACRNSPTPPPASQATPAPALSARGLQVGDPAPDFVLPGSDGQTHSLATYKGKQAVVLAWFAKAFTDG